MTVFIIRHRGPPTICLTKPLLWSLKFCCIGKCYPFRISRTRSIWRIATNIPRCYTHNKILWIWLSLDRYIMHLQRWSWRLEVRVHIYDYCIWWFKSQDFSYECEWRQRWITFRSTSHLAVPIPYKVRSWRRSYFLMLSSGWTVSWN